MRKPSDLAKIGCRVNSSSSSSQLGLLKTAVWHQPNETVHIVNLAQVFLPYYLQALSRNYRLIHQSRSFINLKSQGSDELALGHRAWSHEFHSALPRLNETC